MLDFILLDQYPNQFVVSAFSFWGIFFNNSWGKIRNNVQASIKRRDLTQGLRSEKPGPPFKGKGPSSNQISGFQGVKNSCLWGKHRSSNHPFFSKYIYIYIYYLVSFQRVFVEFTDWNWQIIFPKNWWDWKMILSFWGQKNYFQGRTVSITASIFSERDGPLSLYSVFVILSHVWHINGSLLILAAAHRYIGMNHDNDNEQ